MTAAAMQAIRDGAIVSAAFDSANHLILTKHDGTTVDGGALGSATTTLAGPVELATNAETQSGSATNLAVTPAGLASLPGYRVQVLASNAFTESADPTGYPYGTSMFSLTTGSGWSINGGFGTVVTESISISRTVQTLYENSGGTASTKAWVREYNNAVGGGGWTAWAQMILAVRLNEASFTQLTAMSTYPSGRSYLYYTTANGGSWDFSGTAGTVETMFLVDKNYATQTFTQHSAGSSSTPNVWVRTSDNTTGWSAWKKLLHDPGAWISYTPTWTTDSGLHLPSFGNAAINCKYQKIGRTVNVKFSIVFGSTTVFGSGATTSDNWVFSLPVAAADSTTDTLGWFDAYQSSTVNGLFRAKMSGTSAFKLNITAGSTASIGSDVDSLQPFTWASTNPLRGLLTYESAS
jgi:hypothetical protein